MDGRRLLVCEGLDLIWYVVLSREVAVRWPPTSGLPVIRAEFTQRHSVRLRG